MSKPGHQIPEDFHALRQVEVNMTVKTPEFSPSRRTVLVGLGAGLTAMALPRNASAQSMKTLRYGLSTFPPSLAPWETNGNAANTVKLMIFRGLMGYDQDAKLVPELAESVEQPDAQTLIFKLRANAKFHNGEPVTAEDVIYSFSAIMAPESTAYLKASFQNVDTMEALDDKTLKITLKEPSAVFTQILANYCAGIVWAGSAEDDPIGAGPYTIKSQEKGVYVELERFPDFYDAGQPLSDTIRFIAYADENLRFAALEAGDVDVIEYLPWQQFENVRNSDRLEISATQGPFMLVLFNVAKEGPFADPLVRRAVGYAIKRQDVIDAAFAGNGEPLLGFPNPKGSQFDLSNPDAEWTYDPEKAKAMLAEAGYPNGFDCTLLATSTYGMHQDTASIVQAYLAMVGINATLDLPDWSSRIKAGKEGNYDIAVHGLSGFYNDPDAMWNLLHSGDANYVRSFGFSSERIDGLLEAGRAEIDPAKREAIYKELYQAYYDEVPQVPLNWRTQAHAFDSGSVTGFHCFPGWLNGSTAYVLDESAVS
ncbi:ABC transporter substrate-binding protein [Frigidibacter sp. ROC022]|uniref:ABC transporter substrate-binding protein n=1 Tax=Frigidibacter sp. ROC022 TaxID=2971796 RepID=UPI00215A6C98|nr:ABC transporter substrate-binding protein [Frigidibacter sp. ROC022]MCR8725635.1 ABC transporter substrate-binding protein [Frigidibacter sp. ROC022]